MNVKIYKFNIDTNIKEYFKSRILEFEVEPNSLKHLFEIIFNKYKSGENTNSNIMF